MSQKVSYDLLSNILTEEQSTISNNRSWANIKRILLQVLKSELTPRQREVLLLFFFKHMSVTEIAAELSVNKSTITRTLKRAIDNIKKYTKYYNFRE